MPLDESVNAFVAAPVSLPHRHLGRFVLSLRGLDRRSPRAFAESIERTLFRVEANVCADGQSHRPECSRFSSDVRDVDLSPRSGSASSRREHGIPHLDHRPRDRRFSARVISLRLSVPFTSINRFRGSIPARVGWLGTVTVMRCLPERIRCIWRYSASPSAPP
jgi:hypothetical protein